MRIARFVSQEGTIVTGELLKDDTARVLKGGFDSGFEPTRFTARVKKLLAPLVPTDILCIGLNYREHAAESGSSIPVNPVLFIKASNTLNNPFDPIPIPRRSTMIDYEGELAVVIGRDAKHVSRANA